MIRSDVQTLNSSTANAENKNDPEEKKDKTKGSSQNNEEAGAKIATHEGKRFLRSPLVLAYLDPHPTSNCAQAETSFNIFEPPSPKSFNSDQDYYSSECSEYTDQSPGSESNDNDFDRHAIDESTDQASDL